MKKQFDANPATNSMYCSSIDWNSAKIMLPKGFSNCSEYGSRYGKGRWGGGGAGIISGWHPIRLWSAHYPPCLTSRNISTRHPLFRWMWVKLMHWFHPSSLFLPPFASSKKRQSLRRISIYMLPSLFPMCDWDNLWRWFHHILSRRWPIPAMWSLLHSIIPFGYSSGSC